MEQKGLIHIYTGSGKGKTTAAVGLCVRAGGAGKRVLFAQFLKGRPSAEVEPLRSLGVTVMRTDPVTKFLKAMTEEERRICTDCCRRLFAEAGRAMAAGEYDLVVLDEILDVINAGIVTQEEVAASLQARRENVEAVLTGRSPGDILCGMADYISEVTAVRHPYQKGIGARRGIEF